MGIKRNIILSIIIHVTIITAALAVNSRDTAFRVPDDHIMVSLFEELSENRLFVIGQNNSAKRYSKQSEGSQKQDSSLLLRPVLNQEILRLRFGMTEGEGIIGSKEPIIPVRNKKEIALALPTNDNDGRLLSETTIETEVSSNAIISGGIMPAQGTGRSSIKSQPKDGSNSSILLAIRAAIEKAKTYPFLARKKRIEGTVITGFTINNKGYPEDVKVEKSSGSEILDSAALKIVTKAAPFPKVNGEIIVPITFKLTEAISSN